MVSYGDFLKSIPAVCVREGVEIQQFLGRKYLLGRDLL